MLSPEHLLNFFSCRALGLTYKTAPGQRDPKTLHYLPKQQHTILKQYQQLYTSQDPQASPPASCLTPTSNPRVIPGHLCA
jgi:hypothetical protein